MICSKCGADNEPSAMQCSECGWSLKSNLKVEDQVCANHPWRFSTSVCHACGLELCESCEEFIDGRSYCKECAERPSEEVLLRDVRVVDPETAEPVRLAPRVTALAIDLAIIACGFIVLWVASWLAFGDPTIPLSRVDHLWAHVLFWTVVGVSVPIYFIHSLAANAQTLGMSAVDIAVVRETGEAIDHRTAILRYLAMFPTVISVFGIFWCLWDPKGRMLHDRLTKTRVVKLG